MFSMVARTQTLRKIPATGADGQLHSFQISEERNINDDDMALKLKNLSVLLKERAAATMMRTLLGKQSGPVSKKLKNKAL